MFGNQHMIEAYHIEQAPCIIYSVYCTIKTFDQCYMGAMMAISLTAKEENAAKIFGNQSLIDAYNSYYLPHRFELSL